MIELLFEQPKKDKAAILEIQPLAPLSMVSYMPGSYYRTEETPTKHNLCGLFENILGWHIGAKDRSKILKKLNLIYKKKYSIDDFIDNHLESSKAASGYLPLLEHLFEVENPEFYKPQIVHYDDLWTQQLYRDGYSHAKGTMNISYELIHKKNKLPKEDNGSISNTTIGDFYNGNCDKYPFYYTAPRIREFLIVKGSYKFKLNISDSLLNAIQVCLRENDLGYLGTNEGWVHTKLEEL